MKNISFILPKNIENNINDYIIICEDDKKIIKLIINGETVGILDYKLTNKNSYVDSFVWFGCATMIGEGESYRCVGDFDYHLLFGLNMVLELGEIMDIKNNFKIKYVESETYNSLPILNKLTPHRDNFKIFCDFENSNTYKIWDLTGNGNYPQLYIENNIYF
jgi:hypothetical protein